MVDVVEAEAALDAQAVFVGRAVAAIDVEDLVVLDVHRGLAADAAVGAERIDGTFLEVDALAVRLVEQVLISISAPVGQTCTHSPQATQVELPMPASKSNTTLEPWPR